MSLAQKILAMHSDREEVSPGDLVWARVDLVLGNDITAPVAIREFEKIGVRGVFDRERVILVPDHFTPNKDIKSAEQSKILREFARKFDLPYYYEVGRVGIEHCLLPEEGLVLPGELVVGADSHTCTYGALGAFATGVGSTDMAVAMALGELWFRVPEAMKIVYYGALRRWVTGKDLILYTIGRIGVEGALYKSMEFCGETVSSLSMDSRFTMANMAIEAGAKAGIFEPDEKTMEYVQSRAKRSFTLVRRDPGAGDDCYSQILEINASEIAPQVAFPHLPSNTRPASEAGRIEIQQVVIGSCTNGRMEDFRIAASLLKGRRVHRDVRLIAIPGTPRVYRQCMEEGIWEIFLDAGAAISTPTCGPCLGGHMGILARGERAVSTTNRNFVGRMGHPESEVYLAGPAVAAASAVLGRIADPEELGG